MSVSNQLNTVNNIGVTLVHNLFEQAASEYPDSIAVTFDRQSLTYKQLNEQAHILSQIIVDHAPEEEIIGVSVARSLQTIVAVIAILKAGKAYLPLDPSHPRERLQYHINDANLKTCIATASAVDVFQSLNVCVIDPTSPVDQTAKAAAGKQGALAYVLYTSGSTGKPKGVCMGHQALVNLLLWQTKNSVSSAGSKTLQFAPLSFDVSFQEIFATLCTGGTLVLIDEELRIEPEGLLRVIEEQKINRLFLPFVALQYLTEAAASISLFPQRLQEVITAGEQLKITPAITHFFEKISHCSLNNQYGPTECHVVTELKLTAPASEWPTLPSIGRAIDNTSIIIIDENYHELATGQTGELCISGQCLANGYLNNASLTAAKFINLTRANGHVERIYLTGDLARYNNNGEIEYLGRRDDQVKIRGVRIELGEIEVKLNRFENIQQAVVTAAEQACGEKRLVAYLVANGQNDTQGIRQYLQDQLPDYMIPSAFVWLDKLPKTTSGKIDKKALPAPAIDRSTINTLYKSARSTAEKNVLQVFEKVLGIQPLGVDDNFFELGGNSLLAVRSVNRLRKEFGYNLSVTKLYQYPTIAAIAALLDKNAVTNNSQTYQNVKQQSNADIAVIGMSVRLPGANTIAAFWDLLKEGREAISFFTDEELSPYINAETKARANYVKARGVIDEVEEFDAAFFGINPKAAALMDPQQRIFLEIAWEVLAQTGHLPETYTGTTGVYAGCGNNSYYINNILPNVAEIDKVGAFNVMTLNEKDYIATRTAYELDLKGPAVSVYAACSTSLLAVAQAVDAIRKGYCSIALAGGASVTSPVKSGHLHEQGGILSKDGHCRPFDSEASGTVFSDGAGVVLLKSLEDAIRDGDKIYSVIKGVGVNNDGAAKGSFTAPNAAGQAGAISMAINDAGLQPADISMIEAHGTATAIGDPIEMEGLGLAFGPQTQKQFCAISSVKSNLGHLTAASGIAGFIKATLALYHKQIPATLFYKNPNKEIDFSKSPFYVNAILKDWASDKKRRAGISSFGVGGTNVHVVAEEYENVAQVSGPSRPVQLFTWSAKSSFSGSAYSESLAEFFKNNGQLPLADVAWSLQAHDLQFNRRYFTLASTAAEAFDSLKNNGVSVEKNTLQKKPSEVVFMFPGQGSQYVKMGYDLYQNEPVYRQSIDECALLLQIYSGIDIRAIIFPIDVNADAIEKINNTFYTQPAIFITELALAKLWMSWGIEPTILCGHSIGELVAAHLAGIFNLHDAIKLVAFRSKLVSELPNGKMLSVRTSEDVLRSLLPNHLSLAAVNSNNLFVVAGTSNEIIRFAQNLDEREIPNKLLATSHAFHSAMMDPIIPGLERVVEGITLHRPLKPIMSTVTGAWLTDAEATDPKYWAHHVRKTVRFADAFQNILNEDNPVFIEVGPGNVIASLVRKQVGAKKSSIVSSLENNSTDYHSILKALGRLWLAGLQPDWKFFYSNEKRVKVPLPPYVFDKKYCWIDPPVASSIAVKKEPLEMTKPVTNTKTSLPQKEMRKANLIEKIRYIIEDASGIDIGNDSTNVSFLEAGLDSLLLTQLALTLRKEFSVPITFRQLQEDTNTIETLAEYLDKNLPADNAEVTKNVHTNSVHTTAVNASGNSTLEAINQQLQLLAAQVSALQGNKNNAAILPQQVRSNGSTQNGSSSETTGLTAGELAEIKKPFGATPKIERNATEFSETKQNFIKNLITRYTRKTKGSKAFTQNNRAHMADPRVVSGFSPLTKELVYPVVVNKSKGSRLWDVDGNEYVDALNGFGSNFFGYQPSFLKEAIYDQVEKGFELGPQHELAGEVSKMICNFTGFDRSALCNTGSEAVLGALRIARTVTGRSLVVAFTGSYHGINDEVIVRGTKKLKSFAAAPGIMPEAVENMLILDYGTEESLQIIRARAHELAAVLVEPVQSRRPEFVPIEFLKEVRNITQAAGTVLIFDEVITGFRMHAGGAQALFNIQADIGTYGKVIGGGLPIGVIAGKKKFMDALDGGQWQYGDASIPEVGVTYFAGTFVRHPLALATAKASLHYMLQKGPALQESINQKAKYLAENINRAMQQRQVPVYIAHFGSLWKTKFSEEVPCYDLLFTLMREKGVHICDGFPCFMTEAHTNNDVQFIVNRFIESIDEMIEAGFYAETEKIYNNHSGKNNGDATADAMPHAGARLGRDKNGHPAWFVADPKQAGKYLQIKTQ